MFVDVLLDKVSSNARLPSYFLFPFYTGDVKTTAEFSASVQLIHPKMGLCSRDRGEPDETFTWRNAKCHVTALAVFLCGLIRRLIQSSAECAFDFTLLVCVYALVRLFVF